MTISYRCAKPKACTPARLQDRASAGRGRKAAAAAAAAILSVRNCQAGILDPAGPVAAANKTILLDSLAIMLCVIIPVIVMTIWFAWWFRAGNTKAKHLPDWEYSGRIELVVWSIPAMIVLFLGGLGWVGSHENDPYKPLASNEKPLKVEVVSLDWKWLFIYPDQGVASVNQLTIPVGVPVQFDLTSSSVFNTFFVPRLGSQIYTMAGMVTRLNLEASEAGTFPGQSTHYSGDGFSDMHFDTIALPRAQFDTWVSDTKSSKPQLTEAVYEGMLRPSQAVPVTLYGGVQTDLFRKAVEMSAPGTMTGAMGEQPDQPVSSPSKPLSKD